MRSQGKAKTGEDTPCARLGAAVRRRRHALGLDQVELAGLAGVGLAFLYELEHGKATLRIDKVLLVLSVLGLELRVCAGTRGIGVAPHGTGAA
jgi:HTH-type transcriptional regulator/antitoxin HipB